MVDLDYLQKKIREARLACHMTQGEVAEKLFLTPQTVSKWEKGLSVPDLAALGALADVLGVPVDRFLREQQQKTKGYVAIDGGGTKTVFVFLDRQGNLLAKTVLGASNPNAVGIDEACRVLQSGIRAVTEGGTAVGVYAAVAGAGTGENGKKIGAFLTAAFPGVQVKVVSDIMGLIGSLPAPTPCVACIMGTGSVVYSFDGENLTRFGGWGYLLDGAGSGYDLGREVLRECLSYEDGLTPDNEIVRLGRIRAGGAVFPILDQIYAGGKDRIASFAPCLIEAARRKDSRAEELLGQTADRIALLIRKAGGTGKVPVILGGGLTQHKDLFSPLLRSRLGEDVPLLFPEMPPFAGGCRLGWQLFGTGTRETFERNFARAMREMDQ